MTLRLSDALVSISRDPLPFLLTLFVSRSLALVGWHPLGYMIAAGFLVSVLRGALKADSAPLPGSKELPRAAYLGCLAGCGLWSAVLFAVFVVALPMAILHLDRYAPYGTGITGCISLAVGCWLAQSWFCAGVLAHAGVVGQDVSGRAFNGFGLYLKKLLLAPPFNLSGLVLLLLFGSCWLSEPLLSCDNALAQSIPLFLATLYVHGVGQYLRKGLGLQLS